MKRALLVFIAMVVLALCFSHSHEAQTVVRRPITVTGAESSSLLTNLAASWKFDESSGNAADDSGGGNTLTNNNTVTFNTGKINNAGYFTTASSQYFSLASNASVQTGDVDFTIGCWVYIPSGGSGTLSMIVAKTGDAAGADEYQLFYFGSSDQKMRFQVYRATDTSQSISTASVVSTDTWHCVIAWHDAATDTIGVRLNNNTADTTVTAGTLQAASTADFNIGRRSVTGNEFYATARIDNVNIWKRVLTSTERDCFYNSGNGTQYPFTGVCN